MASNRRARTALALLMSTVLITGPASVTAYAKPQIIAGTLSKATLSTTSTSVKVRTAILNVRSAASIASAVLGNLKQGDVVQTTGRNGAWWQIQFRGKTGYIYAPYTSSVSGATPSPTAPDPAPTSQPANNAVRVIASSLNVRSGPGTGFAAIGALRLNQVIQVVKRTGGWLQVNFNGRTGYISAAYTVPSGSSPSPTTPAPTATTGGGATPSATRTPSPVPTAVPTVVPSTVASTSSGFELGGHVFDMAYLPRMKAVGMSWAKVQVVFNDTAPDITSIVNAAHAQNMKLLIGAVGNRARAAQTNYHREFAAQLANMARQGADAIEVWNEPNLDREYGGSNAGQVNPENYVNMLRQAHGAIKAARAATLVISAATAPTGYFGGNCSTNGCDDEPFLKRMGAAGAANYMDCAGAHHNGTMIGPDQRTNAPVGSSGHHQWYFWGTLDAVYNALGGRTPVCWTELGYVTGEGIGQLPGGFSWGGNITLANQASWLARSVELSRSSSKVRLMIIWNIDARQWDADPQSGFSIFRPDGTCPSCTTLANLMPH